MEPDINSTNVTSNNTTKLEENFINSNFEFVLVPLIITIGILCNLLTAGVMLRPKFRSLSSSVYLLCLAFADCLCLLVDFKFVEWLYTLTGGWEIKHWVCYLQWWIAQWPYFISSWLIVAVTGERVIIVCWPLQAKSWLGRGRAWLTSGGIVVGMMVLGLVHPALVNGQTCLPFNSFQYSALIALSTLTYSIIPFFLIAAFNLTIVLKLLQQRHFMADSSSATSDGQRLTGMLLTNSCVFLILTLPFNLLLAYRKLIQNEVDPDTFWITLTHYLVTINHSSNFLLYTLSGTLYRQELKMMLCGWRRRESQYTRGEVIEDSTILSTSV